MSFKSEFKVSPIRSFALKPCFFSGGYSDLCSACLGRGIGGIFKSQLWRCPHMYLIDNACKNAQPTEKSRKIADGNSLYLEIMPNGSKYWRLKYRFAGNEKRLGLGPRFSGDHPHWIAILLAQVTRGFREKLSQKFHGKILSPLDKFLGIDKFFHLS